MRGTNQFDEFAPQMNRDGLNLLSSRSEWYRINRYYKQMDEWDTEAVALASVDSYIYDRFSYHPPPLNSVSYSYNFGTPNRKVKSAIRLLKKDLRELLEEQDALWSADWDEESDRRWEELETEIQGIRLRLRDDFDEYVEPGNRKPEPKPVEPLPVVEYPQATFEVGRHNQSPPRQIKNWAVREYIMELSASLDKLWAEACQGGGFNDARRAEWKSICSLIDDLRPRLYE